MVLESLPSHKTKASGLQTPYTMDLTVLVDNNTLIDRYFLAEPAFSVYIKEGDRQILFDCGYSDVFLRNALTMGIDLNQLDTIIISHGHIDHTGGLPSLLQYWSAAESGEAAAQKREFVFHPAALALRTCEHFGTIGTLVGKESLAVWGTLQETVSPYWLNDNMVFLGEIPTLFPFEERPTIGLLHTPEGIIPDTVPDDSALACLTDEGMVLIAGCSHAGICSTVEYAKEVTGENRIVDIIGGMHLYDAGEERITATAEYLKSVHPASLHPCHCTGKRAMLHLAEVAPGEEVGVGLTLHYPTNE